MLRKLTSHTKEWGALLWRCTILAIIVGLTLGMGSGIILEVWQNLTTLEVGVIIGVCLWVSSLLLAIYLTESIIKRRIKKYAMVIAKLHKNRTPPANHNDRYYSPF